MKKEREFLPVKFKESIHHDFQHDALAQRERYMPGRRRRDPVESEKGVDHGPLLRWPGFGRGRRRRFFLGRRVVGGRCRGVRQWNFFERETFGRKIVFHIVRRLCGSIHQVDDQHLRLAGAFFLARRHPIPLRRNADPAILNDDRSVGRQSLESENRQKIIDGVAERSALLHRDYLHIGTVFLQLIFQRRRHLTLGIEDHLPARFFSLDHRKGAPLDPRRSFRQRHDFLAGAIQLRAQSRQHLRQQSHVLLQRQPLCGVRLHNRNRRGLLSGLRRGLLAFCCGNLRLLRWPLRRIRLHALNCRRNPLHGPRRWFLLFRGGDLRRWRPPRQKDTFANEKHVPILFLRIELLHLLEGILHLRSVFGSQLIAQDLVQMITALNQIDSRLALSFSGYSNAENLVRTNGNEKSLADLQSARILNLGIELADNHHGAGKPLLRHPLLLHQDFPQRIARRDHALFAFDLLALILAALDGPLELELRAFFLFLRRRTLLLSPAQRRLPASRQGDSEHDGRANEPYFTFHSVPVTPSSKVMPCPWSSARILSASCQRFAFRASSLFRICSSTASNDKPCWRSQRSFFCRKKASARS